MRRFIHLFKRVYTALASPFRKKVSAQIVTMSPNQLLKGKTAVITGSTSGIGFAIAKAFLNAGANVVVTGRDIHKIEKSVAELTPFKGSSQLFAHELDVLNVNQFEEYLKDIIDLIPEHKIDIFVNNAGIGGAPSHFNPSEEYDRIMNTNLKAVFFLTKYVAQHMIENKIEGNILNISSCASLRPAGGIYGLSKWGVKGLTEGFAKLLIPHKIVVNAIGPGITATPFMGKTKTDDIYDKRNPSKRFVIPDEIANIAVVLTSGMGRMVVGDTIFVSGGAGVLTSDDIDYIFY